MMQPGKLDQVRVDRALSALSDCTLCPRRCGANRLSNEKGWCRTGRHAVVASCIPHLGEEPPISGRHGSGTIFFTHCNLACDFCQNADISQSGTGREMPPEELAAAMLALQAKGCHNINFVTPSHVAPQIMEALLLAVEGGLTVPLVWNSSGYDGPVTLALLDGIVDVYMPDFKYGGNQAAERYSGAPDYADRAREALRIMYNQVGGLILDDRGVAVSGLLVRHLVLPGDLSNTHACLDFLADRLGRSMGLSLMSQYHPAHRAKAIPELARTVDPKTYAAAVAHASALDFKHAWMQGLESVAEWLPDFNEEDPFQRWRHEPDRP